MPPRQPAGRRRYEGRDFIGQTRMLGSEMIRKENNNSPGRSHKKGRPDCGRPNAGGSDELSLLVLLPDYCDDTVHGSAVVTVCVFNTAVRSRSDGLVFSIEHGVEAAVERKYAWVLEYQNELAPVGFQEDVCASMTCGVERIVAYHGVVVRVVIDPNHRLTHSHGNGERDEAVFVGYDDLPYGSPELLCGRVLAIGVLHKETHQK